MGKRWKRRKCKKEERFQKHRKKTLDISEKWRGWDADDLFLDFLAIREGLMGFPERKGIKDGLSGPVPGVP